MKMDIVSIPSLSKRKAADLLVVPFFRGKQGVEAAVDISSLEQKFTQPIALKDFDGKEGELTIVYLPEEPEGRIALLGLGDPNILNIEKLRCSYAQITRLCHKKKYKEISILIPRSSPLDRKNILSGIIEGLLLPNYQFTDLKKSSMKDDASVLIEKIGLISASPSEIAAAKRILTICKSVYFTRDLINGNADDVTPQYLSTVARGLEKISSNIKTIVFDKKQIEKEQMGLLLAVNRGSFRNPAFIIVEYKGNPRSHDHTCLIGKGVTFDTGGLLIKSRGGMETMKDDMSGAAAVLGVIRTAASLKLKLNITGLIPATENSTDGASYKPGDVYTGCANKSVEIIDTDAEGRLILAEALAYAVKKVKPSRIIDIATLTGAVEVALGNDISGLLSNDDALADTLVRAGSETGEKVWRLPLHEEYKESLKSDIADLKNTGGRAGGCIKAAIFLQEFVDNIPWAHLDIGGTAFQSESKRYLPKYASGVGVRLILSTLEQL